MYQVKPIKVQHEQWNAIVNLELIKRNVIHCIHHQILDNT